MPAISVILPVYNSDSFLKESIDSIINQTFRDWELIIINDGSTDKSEEIILSYKDDRIKYHKNNENIGLIKTLNKGIDLSTSKYIARMDADDISDIKRFEKQFEFLENNPQIGMCGTFALIINNTGETTGKIIHLTEDEYLQVNLLFSVPFVHPSMMIRREILQNERFNSDFTHTEDYDLWCRIARNHKTANIPLFLLKYRWHGDNVSIKYEETQTQIKSTINLRELKRLGLNPTEQELALHRVSFSQFNNKNKNGLTNNVFKDYKGLENWFTKIINANKNIKRYNENALRSFLWSRWIIVCIVQKKYRKIFIPKFIPLYKINVWARTVRLMISLSKKKN